MSVGAARFRVGATGDRLAVGDWTCDGKVNVAVVRPRTGEVFVFSTWAQRERSVTVAPTAVIPDVSAPVEATPTQCGPLQVKAGDRTVTVPVPAPTRGPRP